MKKLFLLLLLFPFLLGCSQKEKEFTVLQWNIWQEGTVIPGGYDAIVNEIARLRPDFVTLSEVRNYENTNFTARLVQSLKEKGETYYSFYTYDTGLLSRYPITDSLTVFPEKNDHGSIYRLTADMNGQKIAVYTAHLDYLDDAYYNVRGYDGSTWEEIPIPTTVEEVLKRNVASQRDDAIRLFIEQAKKDRAAGYTIILGGDFNEPSHQDWTEETKDFATYPRLTIGKNDNNKNSNSSLFLYNASYLRLKNVEIGYTLPKSAIRFAGLQNVRFYVQGMNLLTFDGLDHVDVDPETNNGNGAWYPIQRIFNFGVDITY